MSNARCEGMVTFQLMRESDVSAIAERLWINVDPAISLPNGVNGVVGLHGRYAAVRTPPASGGRIYDLFKADAAGNPIGIKLASVGITVDAAGIALIS